MKSIKTYFLFIIFSGILSNYNPLNAQSTTHKSSNVIESTILKLDRQFWQAYNTCNLKTFQSFLTEDLEFYHDKSGLTSGLKTLMLQITDGLCNKQNGTLRREAVKGSLQIFPLHNYGAMITGEHIFYLTAKNQKERLVERARFTHIWRFKNNVWKMSRVISYDHQPITANSSKKGIQLSDEVLKKLIGTYKAPNTGIVTIKLKDGVLEMKTDKMNFIIHPESEMLFFVKQAPLTLEFVKGGNGKINQFIVRENGKIVEKANRMD